MTVAAHAIEEGQSPMASRPVGQAQLGFLFIPKKTSLSLVINDKVIILIFLAPVAGGRTQRTHGDFQGASKGSGGKWETSVVCIVWGMGIGWIVEVAEADSVPRGRDRIP